MGDGEDLGGIAAATADIIAQYQTTRVRALWTNYLRIFQITRNGIVTVDPSNFSVTNSFPYSSIVKVIPDEKIAEQFSIEIQKAGKYVFKCTHRNLLLCQLFEQLTKTAGKMKPFGPYRAERLRKNQTRHEALISASPYGIVEQDPATGAIVQEYAWVNISRVGTDETTRSFFFLHSGRIKIFFLLDMEAFISGCKQQVKYMGLDKNVPFIHGQSVADASKKRADAYSATGSPVSMFTVNKATKRSPRMLPRQLLITEQYVVEKDSSGFQYVAFQKLSNIYAVVRSCSNPREFTIEYIDGSSRVYNCSVRDTLLAILQDVAHSGGNLRVIVTGEVSDNLRLMPRFAEEVYESRITDAFFGAFSIEMWFLRRLERACAPDHHHDIDGFVQACRDLNANVPFPGISATADANKVRECMIGILRNIQSLIGNDRKNPEVSLSRPIAIMLQTLYRLLLSTSGYKNFIEIKEIDPRYLLMGLLRFNNDFVNYWTLQVMTHLCHCPLKPKNTQVEFVNKHALLIDGVLKSLIELMSSRIVEEDIFVDDESSDEDEKDEELERERQRRMERRKKKDDDEWPFAVQEQPIEEAAPEEEKSLFDRLKPEEKPFQDIWAEDDRRRQAYLQRRERKAESKRKREEAKARAAAAAEASNAQTLSEQEEEFFPNSLVIVGAASLLESTVCSQRATSSPELIHKILDLLAERPEILVHMLRSPSFLIAENASILLHVLLKNRPFVLPIVRDVALSECLVLRHFFNSIFSPSACQRFISRFLCATFMSGDENSDGKRLLRRVIPSGLVEYLKHGAISEDHRRNLDLLEDEFYATYGGSLVKAGSGGPAQTSNDILARMRAHLTDALREKPLREPPAGEALPSPGNFRIMFHAMTNDHQLPDLIWNEQTRLELRSSLEREFAEFEREQQLKGFRKIAWNFQQFRVNYESLKYELQVGPIYIRCFLEIGDAFIRDLENPSHTVLFEKLMRRVLANLERDPQLSVLCVKCMCRLYEVCKEKVGEFDDMMIIVRMLDEAKVMELQHTILDLLEIMALEDQNLTQLLNKDFVLLYLKFCSLAHLNPDQIGNVLARATNKTLLITDGSSGAGGKAYDSGMSAIERETAEAKKNGQRSHWVPDDIACPKVWFVAPFTGKMPPPPSTMKGPYRVTDLLQFLDNGAIDDNVLAAPSIVEDYDEERFESQVDTGKWKPLKEYFQFRMQMADPANAHYTPADVARRAVNTVSRLAGLHKSVNSAGIPFYPVPTSKRLFSDLESMGVLAQLFLCNDTRIVDIAAALLKSLVEHNLGVSSKLYLTGVFFFGCRYLSNNMISIAELFKVSHLRQSFHDGSTFSTVEIPVHRRSVLGTMLPASLILALENQGAEAFAKLFTGTADDPEVIWNAELRKHVVEMVNAHLGDFPLRLKQFTLGRYDYCPIPKIHFPSLDKELYVHIFYVKNLVDEVRFPNWPIKEPLILVREAIERWRAEMAKTNSSSSSSSNISGRDAQTLFGLSDGFSNADLRRAYKNLARKYHPDKNPNGREMFEKLQKAYELLSHIEMEVVTINYSDVVLLVKTQNLVYKRFPTDLADQKYPVYNLLISVMKPPLPGQAISDIDAELLDAGVQLMYHSCSVSLLNSREFVRSGGVPKLHDCIDYALSMVNSSTEKIAKLATKVLEFGMKTLSLIAFFDVGRDALALQGARFGETMYHILGLDKTHPLSAEFCIESIARCCTLDKLQNVFVCAGTIWRLIPFLLAHDNTLQRGEQSEDQRRSHNQHSSNMHAELSARALGRMAGYMFDDLASPHHVPLRHALEKVFTSPIAKLLRNRRPDDLLRALNENVEKPTRIWNIGMRNELLNFISQTDKKRKPGSNDDELTPADTFAYSNLTNELCISGVYVRIFIKHTDTRDIDDSSQFLRDMLTYLWDYLAKPSAAFEALDADKRCHVEYVVEAVKLLASSHEYIAHDMYKVEHGLDVVFNLIRYPERNTIFNSGVEMFAALAVIPEFVNAVINDSKKRLWILLKAVCVYDHASIQKLWTAAEAIASIPDGLQALVDNGAMMKLLGIVFGVPGYVITFQNRLAANSLLAKFLWNPIKGADASYILRRFLPEPVVVLLRAQAGRSSLQALDEVTENPELIWTREMQGELREAVLHLLAKTTPGETKLSARDIEARVVNDDSFENVIDLPFDYYVKYQQLERELYIGGVYIRLYLKQPTFRLTNPIFFTEKLVEYWDSSFDLQVPPQNSARATVQLSSQDDSKAIVLAKEDFFSLVTSCVICVIKGEPAILEHLLSWGVVHRYIQLISRAVSTGKRGAPLVHIFRILRQLFEKPIMVSNLASYPKDPIIWLMRAMCADDASDTAATNNIGMVVLHKEATLFVEVLKKIFQCTQCGCLPDFLDLAVKCGLPKFLLDHVIDAPSTAVADVRNVPMMKLYATDVLKAMLLIPSEHSAALRAAYERHPAFNEYRTQSHDLFLMDSERTDVFLLEDASEKKFAGLLTYNVSSFTSQGVPEKPKQSTEASGAPGAPSIPAQFAPMTRAPPLPTVAPAPAAASQLPPQFAPMTRPQAAPPAAAPVPPAAAARSPGAPNSAPPPVPGSHHHHAYHKGIVNTVVIKGPHGIGLDISKTADGRTLVQRFKDMPDNAPNPALACDPPIVPGDIIVAVNDAACPTFMDVVRNIKGSGDRVKLTLERK